MNTQNMTAKSVEAVNAAQRIARENGNREIDQQHLLLALVEQDGGLIPSLLKKMGADTDAMLSELDTAIGLLPKVGTMEGRAYLSSETDRVIKAAEAAAKKKRLDCSAAEFLTVDEGLCVQIMHLGAFDDEPASVAKMDDFLRENGYENDLSDTRWHHEIYLSDPRRVAAEKRKTVIRHPIRRIRK